MATTTEPLYRSLEYEKGATEQACKGVVDPSALIEHARWRAQTLSGEYVRDPMLIAPGRNRRHDGREELTDCLNHLLWDSQEHIEDEERVHRNMQAIRHVALAYECLKEED